MASTMLVHDRRLGGNPPGDLADNTYQVDGTVPTDHIIGWIAEYARRSGGLSNLYIMCHGGEDYYDLRNLRTTTTRHGGFGLKLGKEWLTLYNATLTTALAGRVTKITIFACATADTASYNVGTAADGRRFCGEIALWSRAEVIAAVQTQYYTTSRSFWQWLNGANHDGTIDFGNWEGPVYSFSPAHPNGQLL